MDKLAKDSAMNPADRMRAAKTQEELDIAFATSDKGKGAKAIYDTCKESLPAPKKKGGLFSGFDRPKN